MLGDVRYAFRTLAANPGFTIAAILTLALGIGANTATFSVAWQALWKPLPFPSQDRLVVVAQTYGPDQRRNRIAPGNFGDWLAKNRSFDALAAFSQYTRETNLTGSGDPRTLEVGNVSADFFRMLGVAPILGRPLIPADSATEDARVIVLTESAWRAKFGSDPTVLHRTVLLNGDALEIVGVVPDASTIGTVAVEAWAPLFLGGERGRMRMAFYLGAIGRLRPGVSVEQAGEDIKAISAAAAVEYPSTNQDLSGRVIAFREELSGGIRPAVLMLSAGAALVLLIACANLAGLQLARHSRRGREIAIRAALGATRARIVRGLAIEGMMVALAGGYAGLTLGIWALATLEHFAPPAIARDITVRPDAPVMLYALVLSVLSGLTFSTWPGWRATARPVAAEIGGRGVTGDRAGTGIRMALVAGEVALAIVVLIGAALLVTSLVNVLRLDPGFEFDNGLVADVVLPDKDYPTLDARVRFFDQAIARVAGLPGVEGACVMNQAPLAGQRATMTYVAEGQTRLVTAVPSTISPQCIGVLRIPLRRGHTFSPDEPGTPVLVSESMGAALFKGADPLGRRIHMGLPSGPLMTIVGIAGNIRHSSLESGFSNQVWMSYAQPAFGPQQLLVRTTVPPASLASAIRSRIRELDPRLPVAGMKTMADLRAQAVAERRFSMQLLVEFAIVALVLCSLGIYGLLAQIIGHRTKEIGVRLALGARPFDVVRHVVAGTAIAVAVGAAAGTGAALLGSRLVQRMLFGVAPTEPSVYIGIAGLMMTVALIAAWLPARRAASLDPLVALRHD